MHSPTKGAGWSEQPVPIHRKANIITPLYNCSEAQFGF